MSKIIHLNPQQKGGVGKSFVASILAQYLMQTEQSPLCIDTDPLNQTFAAIPALKARWLNICDDNNKFDQRKFDELMERFFEADEETTFVVDCGTSTFLPLCNYIAECGAVCLLQEQGAKVYIHSVLAGGKDYEETVRGMMVVAEAFAATPLVLWFNEFQGKVPDFEKTKVFELFQARIHAMVRIASVTADTFGRDMQAMLTQNLTFAQAIESADFNIMAKQRLKMVWRDLSSQLQTIQFGG